MIQFLIDNEYDVPNKFIERNQKHTKLSQLPFDQDLRRMSTIRQIGNEEVFVYTKGAPEYLIEKCSDIYVSEKSKNERPSIRPISSNDKDQLLHYFGELAGGTQNNMMTHKILSYAFKRLSK